MNGDGNRPGEATEVVRRERVPESFLFGPKINYGTLTVAAGGQVTPSAGTIAQLADPYCNGAVISYGNTGLSAVGTIIMVRFALRPNQSSIQESDVVFLHSPVYGTAPVIPLFCRVYGVSVFIANAAGSTYPTQVDNATSVLMV